MTCRLLLLVISRTPPGPSDVMVRPVSTAAASAAPSKEPTLQVRSISHAEDAAGEGKNGDAHNGGGGGEEEGGGHGDGDDGSDGWASDGSYQYEDGEQLHSQDQADGALDDASADDPRLVHTANPVQMPAPSLAMARQVSHEVRARMG